MTELECSKCGATVEAACNCAAAYVPAGARAAQAVAENPEKSDRAIAAELGVGSNTVSALASQLRQMAQLKSASAGTARHGGHHSSHAAAHRAKKTRHQHRTTRWLTCRSRSPIASSTFWSS